MNSYFFIPPVTNILKTNSYIIRYNNDIDISEGLLKFQEDEKYEKVPVNNRIDNSYPGLYIPTELEIESKR